MGRCVSCVASVLGAVHRADADAITDTDSKIVGPRLVEMLSAARPDPSSAGELSSSCAQAGLHHITAPTLTHLMALLIRPPSAFPPPKASILVIDTASSVFAAAFPKGFYSNTMSAAGVNGRSDASKRYANRKLAVLDEFITKLSRLAVET